MEQPFGGLRVVDFSRGMPGALCTMVMADNGAEVIKVEPPGGDPARRSPGFLMWNRGKKGVVLDLESAAERKQAIALALTADVVVESFRPGEAQRFGLDYPAFEQRPDLVYCSISGFGLAEEFEHFEARDEILLAKTGRLNGNNAMSGAHFSGRPVYITTPFASYGAGGLALEAISAALFIRGRTGLGQQVRTSILDGLSATTMRLAFEREGDKVVPRVSGASALVRAGILLTFMTAKCKDGRYLQMCARQDQHFKNWLSAIGLAHIFDEERYAKAPLGFKSLEDISELEKLIRERMLLRTADEWIALFSADFDVGADPFLTPAEFLEHPQRVENGRIVTVDDPRAGPVKQVGALVNFSESPSTIATNAPALGEHQTEVPRLLERRPHVRVSPGVSMNPVPKADVNKPPLDGISVVELAYFLAAPWGPALLAELGARIIKIEPLTGDPYRRAGLESAQLLNGKESLPIDLKRPEGREILRRVVERCDAAVHNFRPGVPERLGVDYPALSAINPKLVYLYGASYGSKGPEKHRPAFHSTPHALDGAGILQGGVGNPPVDDSYPDMCSGIGAAMALMMGLLVREKTGRGQYLETTMLTSSGYVFSERLTHYRGMPELPMLDGGQFGFGALDRLYPTRDGWLLLSVKSQEEWERFAEAVGRSEWMSDSRFSDEDGRRAHAAALTEAVEKVLKGRDAGSLERALNQAGAPCAAVATSFQEFMVEHGLVEPEEHWSFGTYWRMKPRARLSRSPNRRGVASAIGEHTLQLLDELGYPQAEIHDLVERGIVAAATVTAARS